MTIHVVTSRHPDVAAALLDATGLADLVSGDVDGLIFGPAKVTGIASGHAAPAFLGRPRFSVHLSESRGM